LPPPVPDTVTVRVPALALLLTVTAMVDDPVPVIEVGLKLTLKPLPLTEADKLIEELKPFKAVVLIVEALELPGEMVRLVGLALMLKSATAPVTVSETPVVWVMPPPVAITVIVYVPLATVDPTVIVMVEDPAPGAGIGLVLKLTVTPAGCPEADKVMAELKPPLTVVVIVDCPELPCATETEPGDAEMLKLGAAGPASALSKPLPFGLPQPVTKSYPVVAEYVPLLPLIMSWKSAS
jgi:hypothetical protein